MKRIAKQGEVDEVLHAMVHCNAYTEMIELATIIKSGRWKKMSNKDRDEMLDDYYKNLSK